MPMTLPDWGGATKSTGGKGVVSKVPKPTKAAQPLKPPLAQPRVPAPIFSQVANTPMAQTKTSNKPKKPASVGSTNSTLGQNSYGSYGSLANFDNSFNNFSQQAAPEIKEPEKPKPMSEADWLAEDDIYDQELAALTAALKSAAAQYGSFNLNDDFTDGAKGAWNAGRLERDYDTEFNRNLKSLGWSAGEDWNPSTYMDNRDSGGDFGSWNQADRMTSYGSSYNNQLEDFASRGLLDSSAYMQALGDMNRGYSEQLGNMVGDRTSFINNMQDQYRDAFSAYGNDRDQAKLLSLQRRAAEFGL